MPINALMERSLHHLQWFGAIEMGTNEEHGGFEYRIAEREWISELAEITRNFLESYYVVLKGLESLKGYTIKRADLPERLKEVGEGLLAIDEIRRPEALSLVNLKNAIKAFREEGLLQYEGDLFRLENDESVPQGYLSDLQRLLP